MAKLRLVTLVLTLLSTLSAYAALVRSERAFKESHLAVKFCSDQGLELIGIEDLYSAQVYPNGEADILEYRNVPDQTVISAINLEDTQRIVSLRNEGKSISAISTLTKTSPSLIRELLIKVPHWYEINLDNNSKLLELFPVSMDQRRFYIWTQSYKSLETNVLHSLTIALNTRTNETVLIPNYTAIIAGAEGLMAVCK
jgi:hypothetical protein